MKRILQVKKSMSLIISVIFMSLVLLVDSNAFEVGKITKAKGKVQILKKNSFKAVNYKLYNGVLELKDIVRTKRKSYANINFIDKSTVFLEEKSRLIIEDYQKESKVLTATTGKVIYKIHKQVKGTFQVKTPTALIGVKGTEFATIVKGGITYVFVREGLVEVKNPKFPDVVILVEKGKATVVNPKKPPKKPVEVKKEIIKKIFKEKEGRKKEESKEQEVREKEEAKGEKEAGESEITEKEKTEGEEETIESEVVEKKEAEKTFPEEFTSEILGKENENELSSTFTQEITEGTEEITEGTEEEIKSEASAIITGTPENLKIDLYIPPTKLPE